MSLSRLLDHLLDALGSVAAAPASEKGIREVVGSGSVVGACDPAAVGVEPLRHAVKRRQALPLVFRVPALQIAQLPMIPQRDAANGLVADMSVGVGGKQAPGGYLPSAQRFPELAAGAGAVHGEHRGEPLAVIRAKPTEGNRTRAARCGGEEFIDDRTVARAGDFLRDGLCVSDLDGFVDFAGRFPVARRGGSSRDVPNRFSPDKDRVASRCCW